MSSPDFYPLLLSSVRRSRPASWGRSRTCWQTRSSFGFPVTQRWWTFRPATPARPPRPAVPGWLPLRPGTWRFCRQLMIIYVTTNLSLYLIWPAAVDEGLFLTAGLLYGGSRVARWGEVLNVSVVDLLFRRPCITRWWMSIASHIHRCINWFPLRR